MGLVVLEPEHEGEAERGAQPQDARQDPEPGQVQPNLRADDLCCVCSITLPGPHLPLVESAEHDDGVEEHDHVPAQHLPHVEEDGGETHVIEAASSEGVHFEPVLPIFILSGQ